MKKIFLVCIIFSVFSCGFFDSISDISVSIKFPNEIVIINSARVSTLNSISGELIRSNKKVYDFHFEVDIPAGYNDTVRIDDFAMQEGDKLLVKKVDLSWDM